METLTVVNEMTTITVAIEQGEFSSSNKLSYLNTPNTLELATIVFNLAYSEIAVNRLLVKATDRLKLSKPFTFSIAIECGDKSLALPDITTKMTLNEDSIEKLFKNLSKVIALQTMDFKVSALERVKALESLESVQLVLS